MSKLRPECTVEHLHERQEGSLPALLGVHVLSLEEGVLTAELTVRKELLAPNGFLHAATVIGLADTACGYACIAHLPQTARNFTTIELKSNFLGTATQGTLRAVASGAHLGRSTQVWDATVFAPDGKTIALFRCTQMVLYCRSAAAAIVRHGTGAGHPQPRLRLPLCVRSPGSGGAALAAHVPCSRPADRYPATPARRA
jgi:uncharacterized protein (TIGR00369 family)